MRQVQWALRESGFPDGGIWPSRASWHSVLWGFQNRMELDR